MPENTTERRTISTAAELDVLPNRAVVLTRYSQAVQIFREAVPDLDEWLWLLEAAPLTVLWEPEPES